MRLYSCDACNKTTFFHNVRCGCGSELFYDLDTDSMKPAGLGCRNRALINCNWESSASSDKGLCQSCEMTEIIPDTYHNENLGLWAKAELSKRWVLSNLGRWGWFTSRDMGERPRFHLLAEQTTGGERKVIMGHDEGLITINVEESDPLTRLERQTDMSERLRTMTAHFRHEIAHFLFVRLSRTDGFLSPFHILFGDEEADYGAALKAHYENGPPQDWNQSFITKYASSHPHEDWAETAAHVMHLTDIIDSAQAANLQIMSGRVTPQDAYADLGSEALFEIGAEYGVALNHVNRSIGMADIYPFITTPAVTEKLTFAHERISMLFKSAP